MRRAVLWPAIAGGVVAGGLALDAVGLPSSYLFAALLLGLAIALSRPDRVALPPLAFRASQAIAGVSLGAYLQAEALNAVAGSLAPVLIAVFGGGEGAATGPDEAAFGTLQDWALTAAIAAGAGLLARGVRIPAGTLLGPMLVAGGLTLAGVEFAVPPAVREVAFGLIGLQVGLRFTVGTVKLLGRLIFPVLGAVLALVAGCAALAVVLTLTTDVSFRDAYLATTPGGIYAVLAVAVGAGANTTFILAVQVVRLLVAVLLAPLAVRRFARTGRPGG
jgi:membrane AbrB-like protein